MNGGVVRPERTYWRDQGLSERHRKWGFNCPVVDLDFILLQYDAGMAMGIVEYKHEEAAVQYSSRPSYRALSDLGTKAEVPVFAVRYAADFSWYRVTPLNAKARDLVPEKIELCEIEYVRLLYRIRGRAMPADLLEFLEL